MKEALGALLVGLVLGVSVPWLFSGRTAFKAQPSEKDQPRKPVERPTNGQGFVKLDHPRQVSAGIVSANPQPMQLAAEVKAYGRVLDPMPLTNLLIEIDSAQATLDASAKEYARATTLFADNQNASARALESATAAMKRDRALRDAAKARLLTGWGKSVAERDDLPALLKALTALESALVRLDLPPGQPLSSAPLGARLVSLSDENRSAQADFLGPAPSTDGQTQGTGLLFLLRKNALEITPGAAVTGFIKVRGDPLQGVEVPGSAVVRHERRAWVYVQTGKARFTRTPIPLEHASGDGWFVSEGVGPSDRIVVSGAQVLLSEELKSQIGFPE
jgi:predicted RNA-binding Zn ribbon-like protein